MNRNMKLLVASALAATALAWFISERLRPTFTVLPNGFVLRDQDVLTSDRRTVLVTDAELLCFDDRFLFATSLDRDHGGLFDAQSQNRVKAADHPEIDAPGGLNYGRQSCNGYYTAWVGPGLLQDGAEWPFMPSCYSVNHANTALRDRSWLNRPCDSDKRPGLKP
jgi:hypothetical protein